jgi:hypothetical protein
MSASRLVPAQNHWRASLWIAATGPLESFSTPTKILAFGSHQEVQQTRMINDFAPLDLAGDNSLNHSVTAQSTFRLYGWRRSKDTQSLMHAQIMRVNRHFISRWATSPDCKCKNGRNSYLAIHGVTTYPSSRSDSGASTR